LRLSRDILYPFSLKDFSLKADHQIFDGDLAGCLFGGFLGQTQQPCTTGNLHDHDRQGVDLRLVDPGRDFLNINILPLIQLGTGDGQAFPMAISLWFKLLFQLVDEIFKFFRRKAHPFVGRLKFGIKLADLSRSQIPFHPGP
jgi:hypothetical protein